MSKKTFKKYNFLKLEKEIEEFTLFSKKEKKSLINVFSFNSKSFSSSELKLKVYELVLQLRLKVKRPIGLFLVLGWRREWNKKYAAISDIDQNVFKDRHFNLVANSFDRSYETIRRTVDFDGAILISPDGVILASGVYLENTKPKEVSKVIHPGNTEDLSSAFGFMKKVHTRHLTAISASYLLKGTTIFVLSEEDQSARIFERGKIIWSTIPSEIAKIIDND